MAVENNGSINKVGRNDWYDPVDGTGPSGLSFVPNIIWVIFTILNIPGMDMGV